MRGWVYRDRAPNQLAIGHSQWTSEVLPYSLSNPPLSARPHVLSRRRSVTFRLIGGLSFPNKTRQSPL